MGQMAGLPDSRGVDGDADLTQFDGRPGTGEVRLVKPRLAETASPLALDWALRGLAGTEVVYVSVHVVNDQGLTVLQCDSRLVHPSFTVRAGEDVDGGFVLRSPALKPGRYRLDVFVCRPSGFVDVVEDALRFDVPPILPYPNAAPPDASADGTVLADFGYATGGPT